MKQTAVYSAKIAVGPEIFTADAIRHEGGVWIVPQWLEQESGSYMQPERMLRVDLTEGFLDLGPKSRFGRFLVKQPIEDQALHGRPTAEQSARYSIAFQPELWVRKPEA